MLHVGEHEFLVLLLVVEAQFDERQERGVARGEQSPHARVDVGAVIEDRPVVGSRDEPALVPRSG